MQPDLAVSLASRVASLALLTGLALAAGCGGQPPDDGDDVDQMDCADGKCDLPDTAEEFLCEARRADAFDPNQRAYGRDFIRWSCDDVAGVSGDDRGQEYCEYFAIAQLPPSAPGEDPPAPAILGRNLGPDVTYGTTEASLELDFAQLTALEADEQAIAGQCVFTSWNHDIPDRPVCAGGACPAVLGVEVAPETFRMQFEVNSFDAAVELLRDCRQGTPEPGELDDPDDRRHDHFTRGCRMNGVINETAYRKSDSFVCAAAMRFAECLCGITEAGVEKMLVGPKRRGFPLGTWSSPTALPVGCRYVDLGDGSQTIVACDLTAGEIITYGLDLRAHCQAKYADNVVVHVAMPDPHEVDCRPESSSSPYAASCGEEPWVVEP